MCKIIISGASGFIGKYLAEYFTMCNYDVSAISRNPDSTLLSIPFLKKSYTLSQADNQLIKDLKDEDIIINLSGAGIGAKKWTNSYKEIILKSRISTTKTIIEIINRSGKDIKLINASATGFYGDRDSEELNENSTKGNGFLSDVCKIWEDTASVIFNKNNLQIARFGIIMGSDGGALQKMLAPFKFYAGGYLGVGTQYLPWLHIEDLARLMQFSIENHISGVVNYVSPNPINYKEFAIIASKVLDKPILFNTPAFIIKFLMGESSELVLASQKVIPQKAIESGFKYNFADLEKCLIDLVVKT